MNDKIIKPPELLYHGTSFMFIKNYYANLKEHERRYYPFLLTELVDEAIKTAYKKAIYDDSITGVLIIDTEKLGNKIQYDNFWYVNPLPLDCFDHKFFPMDNLELGREMVSRIGSKIKEKSKESLFNYNQDLCKW